MCKVSPKIKLCTCTTNIKNLKHYWILHRYRRDQNSFILGGTITPTDFDPVAFQLNESMILKLLNDNIIFDTDITFKNLDHLEITFEAGQLSHTDTITFGYEYRNKNWRIKPYNPLEWMYKHSE